MEWTTDDRDRLLSFRDIIDCDDIKVKEQIKQVLKDNRYIAHVLNNKELEKQDAEPEDYFGVNILPYYMIPDAQHNTQNYLCYEVSYNELDRYNSSVKNLQIIFYILCHNNDIIDKETGIARHDLLAALVYDQFNYTNYFGRKIKLISDKPNTTDNSYSSRALIFEQITDNNLVKTKNNTPILANKDVVTLG